MHIVHVMGSVSVVSLLYYILISISITTAQRCYDTGNFTTNSTYAQNRNLSLSSLASNIVANGGNFYINVTEGQDPNKVYAHAICRGDSSPTECSSCVNSTSQDLISKCPVQNEAISSWAEGSCLIRYANRSFFGVLEPDPLYPIPTNTADISDDSGQFYDIWSSLMDRVVKKASNGSSVLKYGTAEANFTLFQTIYALMQCTPDLSESDCGTCLRQNVARYESCCGGKSGGVVIRPNCYFGWELYPFYTLMPDAPTPSSPVLPGSPPPTKGSKNNTSRTVIIIIVPIVSVVILIIFICIYLRTRGRKTKEKVETVDDISSVESLQFDFATIRAATDNFSDANKLGQGGFGAVYKGTLTNAQEVAVKRLSANSGQGDLEFKNEVLLVAKLQHRNLVRLQGFCLEGNERLLIYEFVPNTSLDHFIFDPIKRLHLDWERRYKIIGGIARGLLYLHEDSRLRIIHRDLKASNILLDAKMNPKISDFGMARLFVLDETQGNTSRIVGTYGYMAPEYAMHGQFSIKSDVYSFGVLLLEILSGQKNSCFRNGENVEDLLSCAWKYWREGTSLNLIDPILRASSRTEMMRCIHIGLLCVQENVGDRPTMASVVLMLNSYSLTLAIPSQPAFFMHDTIESNMSSSLGYNSGVRESNRHENETVPLSANDASVTELYPR